VVAPEAAPDAPLALPLPLADPVAPPLLDPEMGVPLAAPLPTGVPAVLPAPAGVVPLLLPLLLPLCVPLAVPPDEMVPDMPAADTEPDGVPLWEPAAAFDPLEVVAPDELPVVDGVPPPDEELQAMSARPRRESELDFMPASYHRFGPMGLRVTDTRVRANLAPKAGGFGGASVGSVKFLSYYTVPSRSAANGLRRGPRAGAGDGDESDCREFEGGLVRAERAACRDEHA
jgi:hypothetical protein